MKIHVTSCETHPQAWRGQEYRLKYLWEKSSQIHRLVDDPAEADVIIVGNLREERHFLSLRRHPVICKFPSRCYAVDERDDWEIMPLLPGVYASAHKELPLRWRYRSGSYALYHEDFRNPFIDKTDPGAFDLEKTYLASFTGRRSHRVRDALFGLKPDNDSIFIEDTSAFNLFTHDNVGKLEAQERYSQLLAQSKFAICPRGAGASSIRLFEAMKSGVAPVVISDDWIVPAGPDWPSFSIFIKENEVQNLESIISPYESEYREMGRKAAAAYHEFFSESKYFDYLINQISSIQAQKRFVSQTQIWRMRNFLVFYPRALKSITRRLPVRLRLK